MKRWLILLVVVLTTIMSTQAQASEPHAEVVKRGEYGQVSTIFGTGSKGQGKFTMDHPRSIDRDSKGNIWFVDGSQKTAKLRFTDGKSNHTVIDLVKNKVTRRDGYFACSGLVVIGDTVYVSNDTTVFKVYKDSKGSYHITELTSKVKQYMKNEKYSEIFRMEEHKGNLVFMLMDKSLMYGFVTYHPKSKKVENILDKTKYFNPYNFSIDEDGITIASTSGYIIFESLFPRRTHVALDTNMGQILDAWFDEDDNLWFVLWKDKVQALVYRLPDNYVDPMDEMELVVGSRRGYTDGLKDEVEMDWPTDFKWDGNGLIFADMTNHAIRKLWVTSKPLGE